MSLQRWVEAIQLMGSRQSQRAIRESLKEKCLLQKRKVYGEYLINGEKVWKEIIQNDFMCRQFAREHGMNSILDVESFLFSRESIIGYKTGKGLYGRFHYRR